MNKKQRNRKIVAQNKRNRMINKRYISTIKTLSKLFSKNLQKQKEEKDEVIQSNLARQNFILKASLYSFFDKAVKKKVIHKNTAARKKSKIAKSDLKLIS